MTRKEQIEQAAKLRYGNQGAPFVHGAQLADKTFAEYVRKKLLDHISDICWYLSTDKLHGRERATIMNKRVEQIRAEVERRIAEIETYLLHDRCNRLYGYGALDYLTHILSFLDTLEVKESEEEKVPTWKKVGPDVGQTTLYMDGAESYLERFGYRISLNELDKLPKENNL